MITDFAAVLTIFPALLAVCNGLAGPAVMDNTFNGKGIVSIVVSKSSGPSDFCGGGAISKDWIVTAGTCLKQGTVKKIEVYYSSSPMPYPVKGGTKVMGDPESIMVPTNFNKNRNIDDIGIFKLMQSIDDAQFMYYLLPSKSFAKTDAYEGPLSAGMFLIGWGDKGSKRATVNQQLATTIISNEKCKKAHRGLAKDTICMDPQMGGTCKGDGGDPLIRGESGILVGVASYNRKRCTSKSVPSTITNVAYHVDFISENTGVMAPPSVDEPTTPGTPGGDTPPPPPPPPPPPGP